MTDPSLTNLSKYVRVDTSEPVVSRIWDNVREVRARDRSLHALKPLLYGGGLCVALLGAFGGARLLSDEGENRKPRAQHVRDEPSQVVPAPDPVPTPVVVPDPRVGPDAGLEVAPEGRPIAHRQGDVGVRVLVQPDGSASVIGTRGGAEVKPEEVKGKLLVRPLADGGSREGPSIERPLAPKGGLASAELGKLEPLNEVRYQLEVRGAPIEGVVVVPKGGTAALAAQGDVAARSPVKPGTKGPHGGLVQPVGGELVELVGKKGTPELRAYLLDDKLKPKKVGPQKLKAALVGDAPAASVVALQPDPSHDFLAGSATQAVDPRAVTLALEVGDHVDVALVGYLPNVVVGVGPAAPVLLVFVATSWDVVLIGPAPSVIVVEKHHWKGKGKHWKR